MKLVALDDAGRRTSTIADYTDGTLTDSTNQTTAYTYDGDDHVVTMTAVMPSGTPNQATKYLYAARITTGGGFDNNDVLSATLYPDPTTGNASSSQEEVYTTNTLGLRTNFTDRNNNKHHYGYDWLNRMTSDSVSFASGTTVDTVTAKLGYSYNSQGLPEHFTTYNSSGTVLNDVLRTYNGLGQTTDEYQAHTGAVDTSSTPQVQYRYSDADSSDIYSDPTNGSRATSMIYPDGRVINYNYGTSLGLNDTISRLDVSVPRTASVLRRLILQNAAALKVRHGIGAEPDSGGLA